MQSSQISLFSGYSNNHRGKSHTTYRARTEHVAREKGWKFVYDAVMEKQKRLDSLHSRNYKPTVVRVNQKNVSQAVSALDEHKRGEVSASAQYIAKLYGISRATLYRYYQKWIKNGRQPLETVIPSTIDANYKKK